MARTASAARASVVNRCQESPAANLVLVEADLAFGGLEAFLDRPTDARDVHELGQGGRAWGPAVVEGQLTGGGVAADEETVVATVVGVGVGADVAEPRPSVETRALGSGSRAAALPRRCR